MRLRGGPRPPGRRALGQIGQRRESSGLTDREAEVAELVAQGLGNKEIAAVLALSPSTIASRLRYMFHKLGVDRRAALAAKWASRGKAATIGRG